MTNKICEIEIGKSADYEGKLNEHKDYLKMLEILEKECSFIGITEDHEIIDNFKQDIIKSEKTNTWWGITVSYTNTIYYIKSSKELFEYLKKYETLCKTVRKKMKILDIEYETDCTELTNFGVNDICFYDTNQKVLLRTNTHEGFIFVEEEIDKKYVNY